MLQRVSVGRRSSTALTLDAYRPLVGDDLIDKIIGLARALRHVRICHLNSTATGGGVAELLGRHLPLLKALGLSAEWRLMRGQHEFFKVTKAFHNALQGAPYEPSAAERALYLAVNEESAKLLEAEWDVVVVHDLQPAAVRHFAGARGARWIWRCHVDSSCPSPEVRDFLVPFVREYDAIVFTLAEFLLPGLEGQRAVFIPPAIDPLSAKNMDLPVEVCRRAMGDAGLDLARPILLQVSRFDPWKDPLGVIETYRLVKKEVPEVQLVLMGAMAGDDPEGWELLTRVEEEAAADDDVSVFTNLEGVGNMEVNAFQRGSEVVIQKSIREGFGLVVSEALWKERPVVAGRAGGIPMQFPDGYERYLVDTVAGCAEQVLALLRQPGTRAEFGRAGREHVRRRFLLPRLVRDELSLIKQVLD